MCDLFGSKSAERESNRAANQAKRAAEEAKKKEAERVARLNAAMSNIKGAFEGTPATKAKTNKFDWSKVNPNKLKAGAAVSGLPAGYTYVNIPGKPGQPGGRQGQGGNRNDGRYRGGLNNSRDGGGNVMPQQNSDHGGGRNYAATPARPGTAGTPGTWMIKGPDGKMYDANDPITYTTGKNSAGTAGFDKAFYDKYKNAMLTNYEPQVAKQYGDAVDETTFRLARAGTLESSASTDAMAELAGQNVQNVADVRSQADKAVGDLKKTIAQEKDNAILQAQAVEDPSIASNNALAKVANLQNTTAPTSVLGDIFKVAAIGGASAYGGYQDSVRAQKFRDAANRVI